MGLKQDDPESIQATRWRQFVARGEGLSTIHPFEFFLCLVEAAHRMTMVFGIAHQDRPAVLFWIDEPGDVLNL